MSNTTWASPALRPTVHTPSSGSTTTRGAGSSMVLGSRAAAECSAKYAA
jgi:hypothetical protein